MPVNLTVTVKEPENTIATPSTGFFTQTPNLNQDTSLSIPNHSIVFATGFILLLITIIIITSRILIQRKQKTVFKLSKTKSLLSLSVVTLIILGVFVGLIAYQSSPSLVTASNEETEINSNTLSITAEDINLNIELGDEPVFAYAKGTVKVNTPTSTGYTLMAYLSSDTADLTNSSNFTNSGSNTIKSLTQAHSQPLTANTWGLALTAPASQDSPVFHGLVADINDPFILNVKGAATAKDDTTNIYIGTYITPDLAYGTYTGTTINYLAIPNVDTNDITVRYHGNGLYFDEEGTQKENTLVYSNSCELAYLGGNYITAYEGVTPEISKTKNINDDGTPIEPFASDILEHDTIKIPGANQLKIEIKHGIALGNGSVWIIKGEFPEEGPTGTYWELNGFNEEIYYVPSDTVTFVANTWSDNEEESYGYYAKVTPIYNQKPKDVEIHETKIYYIVKSDNVDEEGNKVKSYVVTNQPLLQILTLPGASKVKVDITYGLTDEAWINIVEGNWGGQSEPEGEYYNFNTWDSAETNYLISGTKSYILNSDTVTIEMGAWDDPVENYDYGLFAKLYPIYDEEIANTIPIRVCLSAEKSGQYLEPIGYHGAWYTIIETEDGEFEPYWFESEVEIEQYLKQHQDEYSGKTIDLYASNYFTIHYDANGGTGTMDDQEVWEFDYPNLYTNTFTKTSHIFTGWNTEPDGTGVDYVDFNLVSAGEIITLYAQWQEVITSFDMAYNAAGKTKTNGYYTMQDGTTSICSAVTSDQITTLIDTRDNSTYLVGKLKDGKCWLLDNLRLDLSDSSVLNSLSSSNTNASAKAISCLTTGSYNGTTCTSPYTTAAVVQSINWGIYDADYTRAKINKNYKDHFASVRYGLGSGKIGVYYNYCATSAGSYCYAYNVGIGDASEDICPKGWHLPTGGSFGEFQALYTAYNNNGTSFRNDLSMPLSGNFNGDMQHNLGTAGYLWSSTYYNTNNMYFFRVYSYNVDLSNSSGRYHGYSVRCVLGSS